MLSLVFVCLSTGGPYDHYPDAFYLTLQGPQPHSLLVTSGGHHLRPVQTCSLQDPVTGADIWWPLKHVWYTPYWNAFLFVPEFNFLRKTQRQKKKLIN